jgi:PHP family Zn ribbon phosphoesterase
MKEQTKTKAVWIIELNCDCPSCNERVDLVDSSEFFWRKYINEYIISERTEFINQMPLAVALMRNTAAFDNQGNEIWEPGMPGFIRVGDEVRVLANAFEGELGQLHNGRRGRVVAVRSGDVIVKTTDGREPVLDGSHYSPYKVEKLVATL